MADDSNVGWVTCAEDGCVGVRLSSGGKCWAHAKHVDWGPALNRLSEGGELDGRGVAFKAELLQRLLNATPHDDEGRPVISAARFDRAIFDGFAEFERATFTGNAWFRGAIFTAARFDQATFTGEALFDGATFTSNAYFKQATFTGDAGFERATFTDADFRQATFTGDAGFERATFTEGAWFDQATFTGDAGFDQATFGSTARFERATFTGEAIFSASTVMWDARFGRATFTSDAWFAGATFAGGWFTDVTFTGNAWFPEATFTSEARFDRATFTGEAGFTSATLQGAQFARASFGSDAAFPEATFTGDAGFEKATFTGIARFNGATFTGEAGFEGATFERARQLWPMMVRKSLVLDGAVFRESAQIEVSAAVLSCKRARFLAGVKLHVRWAQVVLDDADLSAPSVLTGADRFADLDEGDWPAPEGPWPVDAYGTPRLLSVRGADVAGLTVAGVDVQACRFVDAHHLDQLRAEGSNFANTPRGWRWTKRRTIAEEHQWRASEDHQGWYGPENQPPDWLEVKELVQGDGGLLLPGRIAPLYRDLRKGLEDNKDEPGAADFYYGEMEMRRHDKRATVHLERTLRFRNGGVGSSAAAEYAILSLYWLVSGYGLRAWRALATLAAVVLIAAVIFAFWGFAPPNEPNIRPVDVDGGGDLIYERQPVEHPTGWDELPTALRFSAQATTALLRGPDVRPLTAVGEWLTIALRLVGPVLLGLAVLSVRGRVKR